ncbi:hypothetical protein LTR67_008274 [Exophiala xenobiotica]
MPPSRLGTDVSPSVRRNLFSGHITRRPAQGDMDQEPQSQPHPHPHPGRIHQRSVSTPSLSPSPAQSSPFNANTNRSPPNNPLFSHPLLQPRASPTPGAFEDTTYDPSISPNRPLSPRSSAALFPNASIIAVNPLTGRPVLPHIPILPGRLRLTDSDGEGQIADLTGGGAERRDEGYGAQRNTYPPSPSVAGAADYAHLAAAEADQEREERESFDRDLRDKLARHRVRLQRKASASASVRMPDTQHMHTHTRVGQRGAHRTQLKLRQDSSPDVEIDPGAYKDDKDDHSHSHNRSPPMYTGRDRDEDELNAEKDELLSLLMTKLREEVARAEDEAWMFGDSMGFGSAGEVGYDHAAHDLRLQRLIRRVMCNGMEIACSAATAKNIHVITNHDLGRDIIYGMGEWA